MPEKKQPVEMTDENFDNLIEKHDKVIVDFWASWCGPCKMMDPVMEDLAKEYGDKVLIGKVNTEKNSQITTRFGVQAIPTFIFIKNGEPVDQLRGAIQKNEMADKIKDVFDL